MCKMKLILCGLLFQFILSVYIISDVTGSTQLTGYLDKNELIIKERTTISPLLPTASLENKKHIVVQSKSLVKRRKRLRIKNKVNTVYRNSTTPANSSYLPDLGTIGYPNPNGTIKSWKGQKHRKLKKRKKGVTKKHKIESISSIMPNISVRKYLSAMESKNLVLPITPFPITNSISELSTTTARSNQRKTKNIRCRINNGGCAHICNSGGLQKCQCFRGFTLANDYHNCIDLNECLINNGNCQINCTNTIGSYRCYCPTGLRLSMDTKSCEDINECLLRNGHGPCQDTCENTLGGYICSCVNLKGTKLGNDLRSCIDVDECAKDNGGCSHICINTFGKSFCVCPEGKRLTDDLKTCQDITECEDEISMKNCSKRCPHTVGSYRCSNISDLQNDESYNEVVCKPFVPPNNGYLKCARRIALKTFTQTRSNTTKHSIGTKCLLVCSDGFKRRGRGFRTSCGNGGRWTRNMNAKCVPILRNTRSSSKGDVIHMTTF